MQDEIELNPDMLINVLPRLDWTALRTTSSEVGGRFFLFILTGQCMTGYLVDRMS